MSDPIEDLDRINVEAHGKLRRGKKPAPNADVTNSNNSANSNNSTVPQEATMAANTTPVPANTNPAPASTPVGGVTNFFDKTLAGLDWFSARVGEVAVPAAAGAGAGYGIVHFAGDRIPAEYRIPVIAGCAVLMVGGKLIVQHVTTNRVLASGNVPTAQRWTAEKLQKYVEAARKAKVPEDVILRDLIKQGAPVVEQAPAAEANAPVAEVKSTKAA